MPADTGGYDSVRWHDASDDFDVGDADDAIETAADRRIRPPRARSNRAVVSSKERRCRGGSRTRPPRTPANRAVVSSKERRCRGGSRTRPPRTPSNDDGGGVAMRTALSTKRDADHTESPLFRRAGEGPGVRGHLDTPMPSAIMRLPVPV